MLLEMRKIAVNYGKINAIRDISIAVPEGKIVTIIGGNGAGKTTTLRAMSGMIPIVAGEILFEGTRIDHLPAHKVVAHGIAHVPEGRRIFKDMTVEENLRTGAFLRRDKPEIERDLEQVYDRFPRLRERRVQRAQTMSGGEQQMLAIGRALMSKPRLLLMDEPSMGLAPVIVEEIARIIEEINAQGLSVVLVEQNAELALELAHHAYVLETGNTAMEGPAHELRGNEHVRAAYLGL
ncbi:leucine/isoleucine/valine transporter subunit; ATP-binding component of ABC superfamily [Roseovarius sp. EC-HK134]|jgi:branched-chain amino acid transport system ATP-binding protein|uniref:High-affinity branched-chain amino acid transport ATP-binding protein LivF n=1 Tax=Roseovarius mucosus TaxID=215743 RepID=A0A1V0RIC0_9RHOB|nr:MULTISPECIES: ABC transporter ATP-binding protein [Roseovarius]MBS4010767.1 ABC transporter ATP-binding protein [Roseovarius sp.]ARE81539.1 high-affinity branched-chain amino acid transport ATP-binding protein LivF [Roseovarius mucosus]AWZ21583.1 Branched-chain amino acid transport ATP-binding protein LivF [Roseovarius sp. AK1035]EDM31778.1 branched chain amino acid ABC transporter ATP-binding protein [Roseovarius sp. TM1035]MBW4975641.1 ABC transporter ATP-binding protein [Roseovarius muco|tara:strand:- start:158 stop:865 length:708 start_codon:yes stop_codon:yes gene_type:complete